MQRSSGRERTPTRSGHRQVAKDGCRSDLDLAAWFVKIHVAGDHDFVACFEFAVEVHLIVIVPINGDLNGVFGVGVIEVEEDDTLAFTAVANLAATDDILEIVGESDGGGNLLVQLTHCEGILVFQQTCLTRCGIPRCENDIHTL